MKILEMDLYMKLVAGIVGMGKGMRGRFLKSDGSLKITTGFGPWKKVIAEFDDEAEEIWWTDMMMNFDAGKVKNIKDREKFIEEVKELAEKPKFS